MSSGLSQEDVEAVREAYGLFRAGDPAFLEQFEPDARVVVPECLPHGGTYASPWDALEFWNTIGELFEDPHADPEEFIRDGDRLVVLGHFHGRGRATGRGVSARFAHVFGLTGPEGPLSEHRFTSHELVIDTAAVLSAIGDDASG